MAIKIYNSNYVIRAEGKLTPLIFREGQRISVSTNGVKKLEWTRSIKNFNIQIDEMTQENYDKLMEIYQNGENFMVFDSVKNIDVGDYLIPSNSFSLPETEDKTLKRFIYNGNFTVEKV